MKIKLQKFQSEWVGIGIELTEAEIDQLTERLKALKERRVGHFHVRANDFEGDPNVADIEFSLTVERDCSFVID